MATLKPQALSTVLHLVVLALLFLAATRPIVRPPEPATPIHFVPLTIYRPKPSIANRGGGSNRTLLPAKHGAPPPTSHRTFIPPSSTPHPALPMPITIAFDIDMPASNANIGDPLSHLKIGALGMNGDNGIGNHGCCSGIGDSPKGPLGLSIRRGAGVTPPQLIYRVEPEFSEEARKAKYQGVVVLSIQVDTNGLVRHIGVIQSLGLGLDEKAREAVSQWRFRPGLFDGKPVATEATVQVTFQLL
jgi:TonB family protein